MNNQDIMKIALKQSAVDYGFNPNDLLGNIYKIVTPKEISNDARNYLYQKPYCNFVYYGESLVAIVDDEIRTFVESYIEKNKHDLYRCFDAPQITALNNELEKHNQCICHLAQYYLPDTNASIQINKHIKDKLYEKDEIEQLYIDKRFHMALAYTTKDKRHDVLALAGFIDDKLVGVAGASNDCASMWQIGIDVIEEYRHQGVASILIYLLSKEILSRGIVPFYCCAWSNIASKNTARKAGFKDAWVELSAKSIDNNIVKNYR